jgi:hypothetical protein
MIEERFRVQFEILTSRLQGYTRSTPIVSYVADGIELFIDERGCLDHSSVQIVYLRRGCIRIDCMLWKYSLLTSDLDGFDEILDLLLEDSHPTLTRE